MFGIAIYRFRPFTANRMSVASACRVAIATIVPFHVQCRLSPVHRSDYREVFIHTAILADRLGPQQDRPVLMGSPNPVAKQTFSVSLASSSQPSASLTGVPQQAAERRHRDRLHLSFGKASRSSPSSRSILRRHPSLASRGFHDQASFRDRASPTFPSAMRQRHVIYLRHRPGRAGGRQECRIQRHAMDSPRAARWIMPQGSRHGVAFRGSSGRTRSGLRSHSGSPRSIQSAVRKELRTEHRPISRSQSVPDRTPHARSRAREPSAQHPRPPRSRVLRHRTIALEISQHVGVPAHIVEVRPPARPETDRQAVCSPSLSNT